jgi:SAM-dependent methyltransferase
MDRRDPSVEQPPAKTSGAIPFFDANVQRYLASYDADSLGGYVLRVRRVWVLDLLGGLNGRVLDVGCCPGVMTREILDAGCEFWGVDGSPRMIAAGRRRFSGLARAHFAVADAVALPFADETFDGVLCIGVIDRVPRPEAVIAELGRVLKPRGTLVMAFPNLLSPYALWRSHVFYAGIGCAKRVLVRFGIRPRGAALSIATTSGRRMRCADWPASSASIDTSSSWAGVRSRTWPTGCSAARCWSCPVARKPSAPCS